MNSRYSRASGVKDKERRIEGKGIFADYRTTDFSSGFVCRRESRLLKTVKFVMRELITFVLECLKGMV